MSSLASPTSTPLAAVSIRITTPALVSSLVISRSFAALLFRRVFVTFVLLREPPVACSRATHHQPHLSGLARILELFPLCWLIAFI